MFADVTRNTRFTSDNQSLAKRVGDHNSEHTPSDMNKKSVQEVSKHPSKALAKTDSRHWLPRLFRNSYTRDGEALQTADWCIKIAHAGRRETVNLRTPNQAAAASKAAALYKLLVSDGWDAVLDAYKPKPKPESKTATVGDLLREVKATVGFRDSTFVIYTQALRRIASDIAGVRGDRSRFDYRKGGAKTWSEAVDAIPLAKLDKDAVQRWKLQYIAAAEDTPDAKRRASNTVNAHLRNARALFSPKALEFVRTRLVLPDPVPFTGIKLEKKTSTRYISRINPGQLLAAAQQELAGHPERGSQFIIFVLALLGGLRKREIDLLLWRSVDFERGVIRIEATEYFQPKSEDSIGEVDIAPETLALLKEHRARTEGEFVIQSPNQPRHHVSRLNYRCEADFAALYDWLRSKGVSARKALHELRKECGSIIASQQGIFAAARMLRHADIRVTQEFYADKKERITTGLDALLSAKVTPFPSIVDTQPSGGSKGQHRQAGA
jgi:integrase